MFDLDKWQEIFSLISKNWLRTILTALSVSWGIFMLVILLGFGSGLQNQVKYQFRDDAVNSIWIYSDKTSLPYKGLPVGRRIKFTNDDVEMLKTQVEGVEHITGRFYVWGEFSVSYKKKSSAYGVRACHPGHRYLENTIITKGRFLNDKDIDLRRKVTVIGVDIVKTLFGEEDPLNKYINVNSIMYQVVGVYRDEGGIGENRQVYIPISTAQLAYNGADRVDQIMLTTGNASIPASKRMAEQIEYLLKKKHKIAPEDRKALRVSNINEEMKMVNNIFFGIKAILWFVGVCTIIAGVIGVANIMLISIKERTREIGIRKAMGASAASIVGLILQEALMITLISGYLGMIFGIGLLELLNKYMPENDVIRNPEVNFGVILGALFVLVVAGLLAGFFPALGAARVDPVVALRDE